MRPRPGSLGFRVFYPETETLRDHVLLDHTTTTPPAVIDSMTEQELLECHDLFHWWASITCRGWEGDDVLATHHHDGQRV